MEATNQRQDDHSQLLSTREAAKVLGLSPFTLANWRSMGTPEPGLPYRKIGRSVKYLKADVISFRDARVKSSTSDTGSNQ